MAAGPTNALASRNYLANVVPVHQPSPTNLGHLSPPTIHNALAAARRQTPSILEALLGDTPPPVPPFRRAHTEANFAIELQRPFWTVDDIVPLLLGIGPMFATPAILREFEFKDPIAWEGLRLRGLILDAHKMGDLPVRARHYEAINWALKQFIEVHPELIKLALARGIPIRGYKSQTDILTERHKAELELAQHKRSALTKQNEALQAENDELRLETEQLGKALAEERTRAQEREKEAARKPPQENKTLAALRKEYNTLARIFFACVVGMFRINFGGLHKPDLKPVLEAIKRGGSKTDRATLLKHLLYGADQASR